MISRASREELGIEPGMDLHLDDWAVVIAAASPLWGMLIAWMMRWPRSVGIPVAIGPIGGLLVAGFIHDKLRRWGGLPARRAARIELASAVLFMAVVCIAPLVRYYRTTSSR